MFEYVRHTRCARRVTGATAEHPTARRFLRGLDARPDNISSPTDRVLGRCDSANRPGGKASYTPPAFRPRYRPRETRGPARNWNISAPHPPRAPPSRARSIRAEFASRPYVRPRDATSDLAQL